MIKNAESKSAIKYFLNLIGRGLQGGKKNISSKNWTFKILYLIKEEMFIAFCFLFRFKVHGKRNKNKKISNPLALLDFELRVSKSSPFLQLFQFFP